MGTERTMGPHMKRVPNWAQGQQGGRWGWGEVPEMAERYNRSNWADRLEVGSRSWVSLLKMTEDRIGPEWCG